MEILNLRINLLNLLSHFQYTNPYCHMLDTTLKILYLCIHKSKILQPHCWKHISRKNKIFLCLICLSKCSHCLILECCNKLMFVFHIIMYFKKRGQVFPLLNIKSTLIYRTCTREVLVMFYRSIFEVLLVFILLQWYL